MLSKTTVNFRKFFVLILAVIIGIVMIIVVMTNLKVNAVSGDIPSVPKNVVKVTVKDIDEKTVSAEEDKFKINEINVEPSPNLDDYATAEQDFEVDVTADKTGTIVSGTPITVTANASGGAGDKQFVYYIFRDGNVCYTGTLGSSATCRFTPLQPGTYMVLVYAKDDTRMVSAQTTLTVISNLLNLDTFRYSYLDPENGDVNPLDGKEHLTSDFIPVKKGKYCLDKYPVTVCAYDSQHNFIKCFDTATDKVIDVTDDIAFLRIGYMNAELSAWNPMLCNGEKYPDYYIPCGDSVRNVLKDKKLFVLGDSIFASTKSFPNTVAVQNNMNFNRNIYNQSLPGSTLAINPLRPGASFVERFKRLIGAEPINRDDYFNDDAYEEALAAKFVWTSEKPDYFIIDGGVNDYLNYIKLGEVTAVDDKTGWLNETTTCGALESIIRTVKFRWPDCKIVYCTSYQFPEFDMQTNFDAIKAVCDKYDIAFFDLYNMEAGSKSNIIQYMDEKENPRLHINSLGNLKLALLLSEFLESISE